MNVVVRIGNDAREWMAVKVPGWLIVGGFMMVRLGEATEVEAGVWVV